MLGAMALALAVGVGAECRADEAGVVVTSSPSGRLAVEFRVDGEGGGEGVPRYSIRRDGEVVLGESRLGLVREDADFSKGLRLVAASDVEPVADDYEILTAKRRKNSYRANRRVFHLETADGKKLDVVFQVSDDGVAWRYVFPETDATVHRLQEELTSFRFLPGTRAWLQPMAVAKSGWEKSNPSYEEYYEKGNSLAV
jgi:hypothetical protein